jgi:hypothetical protein
MIEKHRNGPTGKIELYFDEKRVTFLPIDTGSGYDAVSASADEDF